MGKTCRSDENQKTCKGKTWSHATNSRLRIAKKVSKNHFIQIR